MLNRWRGRSVGLAILVLPLLVSAATARDQTVLTVTGPAGAVIHRVLLSDGTFTLRYRNSLYGSLAEERYTVDADGTIRLVGLAADELAVLEEYYAIDEPARRAGPHSSRGWEATPAREVEMEDLVVAATDLGERVLIVDGHEPMALWREVDDASPSVTLRADR